LILKIVHWVRPKGPEAIEVGTTRADGRATAEARVLGASGWEVWGAGEAIRTMSMCVSCSKGKESWGPVRMSPIAFGS
jgi:hypothetical protein